MDADANELLRALWGSIMHNRFESAHIQREEAECEGEPPVDSDGGVKR